MLKIGNGNVSIVAAIGNVHLRTSTGATLILRDVRHVPDIMFNLISVSKLDDEDSSNFFGTGQ